MAHRGSAGSRQRHAAPFASEPRTCRVRCSKTGCALCRAGITRSSGTPRPARVFISSGDVDPRRRSQRSSSTIARLGRPGISTSRFADASRPTPQDTRPMRWRVERHQGTLRAQRNPRPFLRTVGFSKLRDPDLTNGGSKSQDPPRYSRNPKFPGLRFAQSVQGVG